MKLKNHNIFITGGAGFIAGHFIETIAKYNKIIIYDNFSSSVLSVLDLQQIPNVHVVKGDILDQDNLIRSIRGADIAFHFAAACVRKSLTAERFVHDVNTTGTLNVLLAARDAHVKRFVHISSSEIYGSAKTKKMTENHPTNPTTVYGMSKLIGEQYAKYFNDHEGLPTIIIRPFNTYGPRSHFDGVYGEVIPRFTIRALNNKQPIIFGSGNQTRDFTYVTDTVDGIIKAATSDKLFGQQVNIARGEEVSVKNIAKIICNETHLPFSPIQKPARPHDVTRHSANITKAKQILSYKPQVPVQIGINSYISWINKTYPDPKKLLQKIPDTNW